MGNFGPALNQQQGPPRKMPVAHEWVNSSVMARAAQIAQIVIWGVILVLGVLAYWRHLRLAPLD